MDTIILPTPDVGFTGTHRGMNPHQKTGVREILVQLFALGYRRFRHGDCVGSDAQAAGIAREVGFYIIGHPGINPNRPNDDSNRAFFPSDESYPPEAFFVRDHKIVDAVVYMIATPFRDEEERRSGTWATVRYARDKKPVVMVWPTRRAETLLVRK